MLENFYVAKYKFTITCRENLYLPPYKGSTLRGGFGSVFRRICCVNKKASSCNICPLKEKCVYAYVFETSPPENSERLKKITEIPRPFVIEPPLKSKCKYFSGEDIDFGLVLIGRAIGYLPYFIFTFRELGEVGIGKERGKFLLSKVESNGKLIYSCKDDTVKKVDAIFKPEPVSLNGSLITLNFLTPTRLKFEQDLVANPEFHYIIRALLHRISALSYFHCGQELALDYRRLIAESEKVKIKKENTEWVDWERYSSRQQTRMKLGGFIGSVTYNGDLSEFHELLALGEYVHIGKGCTFGLGKYEIMGSN